MRVAFILVLLAACGSEAAPGAAPSGESDPTVIGPGSRSTRGMASGGAQGQGGAGGQGVPAGSSGSCEGEDDVAALAASVGGRQAARECLILDLRCVALTGESYENCITECIGTRIRGLSPNCAQCFGAATRCELDNACTAACRLSVCNETCRSCVATSGCLDALDDCTGLIDDTCELNAPGN